jgi:hypothetical protein
MSRSPVEMEMDSRGRVVWLAAPAMRGAALVAQLAQVAQQA